MLKIALSFNLLFTRQSSKFMYKVRYPSRPDSIYNKERVAYKNLLKEYRKKNIHEYWESQTKLENDYIEEYLDNQSSKSIKFMQRQRDLTILKTYQDTLLNEQKLKKQGKRDDIMKTLFLEDDIKKMNRQQLLKMLREESKSWFSEGNIESNLHSSVVLPEAIVDETDYYLFLQEQALYNEMGDFDKLEDVLNVNKSMQWKNRMANDFFQKIVTIVKYLRQEGPYQRLQQEWNASRAILLRDEFMSEAEIRDQLLKLDDAFMTVIHEYLNEIDKDHCTRLEVMNKQLIQLYNLFELWERYTQIIKMNNTLAQEISQKESEGFNLFKESEDQLFKKKTSPLQEEQEELSADEKYTSSDEDIDLEKIVKEQKKDEQGIDPILMRKGLKKDDYLDNEENPQVKSSSSNHKIIERMIEDSKTQQDDDLKRFEEVYKKQATMYDELPNARKLFEGVNLENIFPKELIEQSLSFTKPPLDLKSFEDIQKLRKRQTDFYEAGQDSDDIFASPDVKRLQTLVVVEALKEDIKLFEKLTLNQREKNLLEQNQKLLDMIGEIRLDEPQLLLKLWRLHV